MSPAAPESPMPVAYRCKQCGVPHPAEGRWCSQAVVRALPPGHPVGAWGCDSRPWSRRLAYTASDLLWRTEVEAAEWEDLLRMLGEAEDALRSLRPGPRLDEVQAEIAARRYRVVGRYPGREEVWAAYRTREECAAHLAALGVRLGVGHVRERGRFEVVIEKVGGPASHGGGGQPTAPAAGVARAGPSLVTAVSARGRAGRGRG